MKKYEKTISAIHFKFPLVMANDVQWCFQNFIFINILSKYANLTVELLRSQAKCTLSIYWINIFTLSSTLIIIGDSIKNSKLVVDFTSTLFPLQFLHIPFEFNRNKSLLLCVIMLLFSWLHFLTIYYSLWIIYGFVWNCAFILFRPKYVINFQRFFQESLPL